jgi:LPXTG-motif cell wall-anchored protein
VPGAAVVPNPNDADTSVTGDDPASPTTSPTTSPAAAGRTDSRSDGTRQSAAGLPRVRDDGGSGSPWGVIVAVVVVAMLGLLAVVVRRRRSTA